jgi:1-deoxy-D-xylulose-5-phosphate reductoisomerase
MIRIALLGATGSIGTQTLDIIRQHPERLKLTALAANTNASELKRIASEWGVHHIALAGQHLTSGASPEDLEKEWMTEGIPTGIGALTKLVISDEIDLVVVALSGAAALVPTINAIKANKQIALATKEVLVSAGEIVMPLANERNIPMRPIDSEHSAIWQCIQGYQPSQIKSIILTASGGPFRGWSKEQLSKVTLEQALNHPTWKMGGKITIDSSTMMNKALEMIEAKWLFGLEMDQVQVVVHPQSVLHSLVEFHDTSTLGQLGWPDMRIPIQYALLYPERIENEMPRWNPAQTPSLTFEALDETVFTGLSLARTAVKIGGVAPCVMNAANEAAVSLFLNGKIRYLGITQIVENVVTEAKRMEVNLPNLIEADRLARAEVLRIAPEFAPL